MADPRGTNDRAELSPGVERGDSRELAASVANDFRALVQLLARQAKSIGSDDGEVRAHLARATDAAERGLRLSEQLLKMAEFADDETKHKV